MPLQRKLLEVAKERPSENFELNRDSPQAQGLVGWWPLSYGTGAVRDFSHRNSAGPGVFAQTMGWFIDENGFNINASNYAVNNKVAIGATGLSLPFPYTIVCRCKHTGSGSSFQTIFNNTATPLFLLGFSTNGSTVGGHANGTNLTSTIGLLSNEFIALVYRHVASANADVLQISRSSGVQEQNLTSNINLDTFTINNLQFGNDRTNTTRTWQGPEYDISVFNYYVPNSLLWSMVDPATRWDLHAETRIMVPGFVAAAPAGTKPPSGLALLGAGS